MYPSPRFCKLCSLLPLNFTVGITGLPCVCLLMCKCKIYSLSEGCCEIEFTIVILSKI